VEKIPDGVYEAESFMDDDGVSLLKHIPIKVRVEVSGDKMTIDLSDVSPQVAGFYNSGITAGRSAAEVVFKCVTAPLLLPINDGSFRPLKIILPPGRVVSAVKPAPVRVWMTVPMTVCDTIFRALAPACPERTIAGIMPTSAPSTRMASTHRLGAFFGRISAIRAVVGAPSTMRTA
jgi:N-methylhydantoinase B